MFDDSYCLIYATIQAATSNKMAGFLLQYVQKLNTRKVENENEQY